MATTFSIDPHPLLDLRAFATEFPRPLGEMASPPELLALLSLDAAAPLRSEDSVREAVRNLLRHGGFKPTGRSKPASEYLINVPNIFQAEAGDFIRATQRVYRSRQHPTGVRVGILADGKAREP